MDKTEQARRETEVTIEHSRSLEGCERELQQLVRLGEALGATLEPKVIQRTVVSHLQPVIGQREIEIWLTARTDSWSQSIDAKCSMDSSSDRSWHPAWQAGLWDTFPMFASGKLVGLIGVGQTVDDRSQPLSNTQRCFLTMTSCLVGLCIKNAQLSRQVRQLSAVDVLTGCLTRQHTMNLISSELRRARRSEEPVSLIFIDLDHFKQLNDRYGHLFGDTVLAAVGGAMKEVLRADDLRCRYGGDEFVVLLPDTPLDGAKRVAELLRRHLALTTIGSPDGAIFVTASFGISVARPGELDAKALLVRADRSMYRAKRDGRNSVRVWEADPKKETVGSLYVGR